MKVQPGMSKWTLMLGWELRISCDKCSASVFTADLDALYAGLPGGFVMPSHVVIKISPFIELTLTHLALNQS